MASFSKNLVTHEECNQHAGCCFIQSEGSLQGKCYSNPKPAKAKMFAETMQVIQKANLEMFDDGDSKTTKSGSENLRFRGL